MRSPTTDPDHIAADWQVLAHARSDHRVLIGSEAPVAGGGSALIKLRLFAEKTTTFSPHRQPFFPFAGTPVVLIDGKPALQGFGDAWVEVSRERHLVEVQAGGSRGWWMVDGSAAGPGEAAAELHFYSDVCNPLRRFRPRSQPGGSWFFGPPGARAKPMDNHDTVKFAYNRSVAIIMVWLAVVLSSISPAPHEGWPMALYFAVTFAASCAIVMGLERFASWAYDRPVRRHERTQATFVLGGGSLPTSLPGRQAADVPPIRSGGAAVLDLRFEQVWERIRLSRNRSVAHVEKLKYMFPDLEYLEPGVDDGHWHGVVRYGEPVGSIERPWMSDPVVFIDGAPIEAHWARLHIELSPGDHVLRVEVPRHSNGPRGAAADLPLIAEAPFSVAVGETALAEVLAEVVQDFDGRTYDYETVALGAEVRGAVTEVDTYRRPRPQLRREGQAFQKSCFNFSLEVK